MIDLTKAIGAVAASVAALGGSYTLADKFGWFDRAILEWAPEHFQIVAELCDFRSLICFSMLAHCIYEAK